jgi:hypothetical protein
VSAALSELRGEVNGSASPLIDLMVLRFLCHRPSRARWGGFAGDGADDGRKEFRERLGVDNVALPGEAVSRAAIPRLAHSALHCSQRRSKGIASCELRRACCR